MDDSPIERLGGRRPLPELIVDGTVPCRDPKQAKRFLDRYRVPYVIIKRQRCNRLLAIHEARNRLSGASCDFLGRPRGRFGGSDGSVRGVLCA